MLTALAGPQNFGGALKIQVEILWYGLWWARWRKSGKAREPAHLPLIPEPTEVRTAEIGPAEVAATEDRVGEVRPAEVRLGEIRSAEQSPHKVRAVQVRFAQIRVDRRVRLTSGIPSGLSRAEQGDIVGLCHRMPAVRQPLKIDSGSSAKDQCVGIGRGHPRRVA
jgi:hypothetical protein